MSWTRRQYVTHEQLEERLEEIYERIEHMATQADVDALTAELDSVSSDIQTASASIQAEINALAQANPGLDISKLQAAAAPLDAAVQGLGNLKPVLQAPPPAPVPAQAQSVYTVDAGNVVDTTQWTATGEETTDTPPKPLYTYAGDTAPGDKKGDGLGGVWHLYTGATQPVAPPAPGSAPSV